MAQMSAMMSAAVVSGFTDGVRNDRLEQRAGQVEPADDGVQLGDARQALGVAADVDHAGVPASGEDDQPAPGDVGVPAPLPVAMAHDEA